MVSKFERGCSLESTDEVVVVCEGRLQNPISVHNPTSESIATAIARLYVKHGEQFLDKVEGSLSIAIWDKRTQTLLLARDRLGIRTLCYAERAPGFVFASHAAGVIGSGVLEKEVDRYAIVDYVNFHVIPAPRTAFRDVVKLRPGEYLVWKNGHVRKAFYWEMEYPEDLQGNAAGLAKRLFRELEDSVRVTACDLDLAETGCFLSGGTDSSSIAGFLSRIRRRPARAFSIGFAERRFDELHYARIAARHFNLQHHERQLNAEDAYQLIPKVVETFDEPFGNASAIPTLACLEFAKSQGTKVMLGGDGGDELFGGNERYRVHQIYDFYQRVPEALRKLLEPAIFAAPLDWGPIGKVKSYIRRSNVLNPERYCRWRLLQIYPADQVLGDAMPNPNGGLLAVVRSHYDRARAKSELNRILHIDMNMTLGDEDLPKVTRTAERVGVEVRFPYLQSPLARFAGRLPVRMKVKGLEKRYLFKRAMRDLLPIEILHKKKHGFGLPVGFWLKTDQRMHSMAKDILLSAETYQRGYYRKQFVEQLFSCLAQDSTPYYGDLLWVFLMLELWHRRHATS